LIRCCRYYKGLLNSVGQASLCPAAYIKFHLPVNAAYPFMIPYLSSVT
jgi:hypothetical protein